MASLFTPFPTHPFPFYSPLLLSTIPSSFFSLSAHLPFDFFLLLSPSPLLLSFFTIIPLFLPSRSSHGSLQPTLLIYSPSFSFPQLINPSSSSTVSHPRPPIRVSVLFSLSSFTRSPGETPTRCSFHNTLSSSSTGLLFSVRPVRTLSSSFTRCTRFACFFVRWNRASARARARACVRARKIHVGVTPNARCTHVRPEFMGIFSVR